MPIINLSTNFNNKLGCEGMLHINRAPADTIPESEMNQVYQFCTKDGSYPPVAYILIDIARAPLHQIPMAYTWASHGMTNEAFVEWWLAKYRNDHLSTPMAVYFYKLTDLPKELPEASDSVMPSTCHGEPVEPSG